MTLVISLIILKLRKLIYISRKLPIQIILQHRQRVRKVKVYKSLYVAPNPAQLNTAEQLKRRIEDELVIKSILLLNYIHN